MPNSVASIRPRKEMGEALKRIPLKRVYQALNKRYFFGRMPAATILWVKNLRGGYWATCTSSPTCVFRPGRGGRWIDSGKVLIRLRLSHFVTNPKDLIPVLLHEMIHGYLGAVFGQTKERHGGEFLFQLERVRAYGCRVAYTGRDRKTERDARQ